MNATRYYKWRVIAKQKSEINRYLQSNLESERERVDEQDMSHTKQRIWNYNAPISSRGIVKKVT